VHDVLSSAASPIVELEWDKYSRPHANPQPPTERQFHLLPSLIPSG